VDDDLFLMFYLEMSREFETRFGVEGWCSSVTSVCPDECYAAV